MSSAVGLRASGMEHGRAGLPATRDWLRPLRCWLPAAGHRLPATRYQPGSTP